jgi:prepilin-type N-terminal cleavage/methylation domain-containing protein
MLSGTDPYSDQHYGVPGEIMFKDSPPEKVRRLPAPNGFTLPELLAVVAIVSVIAALALPSFNSLYEECCLKVAMTEIAAMIREAKQLACTDGSSYAVGFATGSGKISLISARGADGSWNTGDDRVMRSFLLQKKGGGLRFGYGDHGPLPGLAATADGVTFQSNNTLVCNADLTGNAGTVYLVSRCGAAMALTMNSRDFGYTLWRWNGSKWVRS